MAFLYLLHDKVATVYLNIFTMNNASEPKQQKVGRDFGFILLIHKVYNIQ